ncbi:heat shock protein 70 family [Blyttiomyces helicus]|uniref:Heat shock protein 70 family n=1 Tax=Blyttiomyces helicus TaxID=388810 RepID=A0A4V1IQM9_9FUNG|nr:heat shock protein 70 family [Blyttiomyces helicus]|eukprot:RKO87117.1 heat shock protein 70 family [Blyttiomyces helicus]
MAAEGKVFIGISFGTLYSSIAILGKNGLAEAIANEDGDRQIPSYVAFCGHGEELAGSQARVQAMSNPTGTIVQFRNLLGKTFDDEEVQAHSQKLPMNIVASPEDATVPVYEVESYPDDSDEPVRDHHSVVEVSAKYLRKLKETAENFLGTPVDGVVISIPAHFEDVQKAALMQATKEAGFETAYPVHEPVAAALAFDAATGATSSPASTKIDKNVLVLDLGGHQFNVTALANNAGIYTVLASKDDPALGGVHFDEILMNFVKQEFKRKTKLDVSDNRRALSKLRSACDQTKRSLSRQDSAPCSVESLCEGMDYHGNINRNRFEMLAEPLYARAATVIHATLEEANVPIDRVDEVLFVGGSSRMPRFQTAVKSLFPNAALRTDVEPDEAISTGCATQAAILLASTTDYPAAAINKDITDARHVAKTLGVEVAGGAFAPLIPAHAPIPARRTAVFGVSADGQREIFVAVYEGEDAVAKKNTLLAEVVLSDLPEGLNRGEGNVEVTFTIEQDQVLTVLAKEKTTGHHVRVKVNHHHK